jgi:hypothetical protein
MEAVSDAISAHALQGVCSSKALFMPPKAFPPTVIGLAAQEGKKW